MKTTHQEIAHAIIEKDGIITHYEWELYKFNSLSWLQDFYNQKISTIVFMVPFRTIRERGFDAHGNEPILAIAARKITKLTKAEVEMILSDKPITLEKPILPLMDDEHFARKVKEIQKKEIDEGNICQMILSQPYVGKIQNFSGRDAESAFRNCLKQRGQYMTVLFDDDEGNSFVSLTPEQHLGITNEEITMNPIAGTLKKWDISDLKKRLLTFLWSTKEIQELFHVLDEELKMMETICKDWGRIEWPFLRQNGAVIHTEYKLIGKRNKNIQLLDTLRSTLHAPTLTGWPIESAVNLIVKYEPISRGYYGGEIGILTSDGCLDTAITIRTAHFKQDGTVIIQAGAWITKDSKPFDEAEEVRLKTSGMKAAILNTGNIAPDIEEILRDKEILAALGRRNEHLSRFHFQDQSDIEVCEQLQWKTVTIIHNKDDFTKTLGRMMIKMGILVTIVDTLDFNPFTDSSDIVILGPWPGDINNMNDQKMKVLMQHTQELMKQKRNILGVCLGHQALAKISDIPVTRQSQVTQWEQRQVNCFEKEILAGFYNSFSPEDVNISPYIKGDKDKNERIIAMKWENFTGIQFHPESIMTENGYNILQEILKELIVNNRKIL